MCISQIPIASYQECSKTIPLCVLVKYQLHLIENVLKEFQIISVILPGPLNENFTLQSTQLRYSYVPTLLRSSRVNLTDLFLRSNPAP